MTKRQIPFMAAVAAVAVVLAAGAGLSFRPVAGPGTGSPVRVSAVAAAEQYRICPVADCSAYPSPGQIKGVALSSLENWVVLRHSADAQIRAVASRHGKSWDGNAIRLQILQDKLVGAGGHSWSRGYFQAVEQITAYALGRHLAVILNAQTEPATGFPQDEQGPTAATYAFWRHFARAYGHNPRVVFDLFNEPRCQGKGAGKICGWAGWQASMWPLVRYVRALGAQNQLWLEGRRWGSQLGGVPLIHCHKAVAWCQGLVYTFHKPGCPWPSYCAADRSVWWSQFGYLAARGVPVVNGEFTNYRGGYYWSHSTATVTSYLDDLHAWHIGVVAWSLQPGIMIATSSLTSAVSEPQGAGRIFWRYFHRH